MAKIIFDIETAGENFDELDEISQSALVKWVEKEAIDEKTKEKKIQEIKNGMGLSPFTAEIVAIGVLDAETNKGAVYFQAPGKKIEEFEKDGIKYKVQSEKEILESFWQVATYAKEFVSFNGRCFDVPFMMIRSAVLKIRPSKNLLTGRYLYSQPSNAKHIDLMDQFTFYGAIWKRPNLHTVCRAFNVKSPKEDGINGEEITKLFKEGRCLEIAEYNGRDLFSTKKLFEYWEKYLKF